MERKSGVLLHVSSLFGEWSSGSFGKSSFEWIDFLKESGFTYWQVLPFCVTDECASPYKSYSAFSINPFFIDLELLFEKGLLTRAELDGARQKSPYLCEFKRLREERMALLERASERFDINKAKDFLESHPHTAKFCEFMARKASNGGKAWQEWECDEIDEKVLRLWQFCQYEGFEEWCAVKKYANEKGIKIIGDMPIYVSLDSSDTWSAPHLFELDKRNSPTSVAGVPPDYFSEDGQLWGNPLYKYKEMKKDSFSWFKERVAFMCEIFDGIRIDHFRGFESYFSVKATERTAKNGKWKKGPGMALIKEIKKVAGDALVIAEDLGVITPEVEKLVQDSGFPGMRVLQFAFLSENSPHLPHNYENNSVAYTGTHDNNTLLGFVWEMSDYERERFTNYFGIEKNKWNDCYDEVLRVMLQSHAGLVIFPIQDLLKYGADTRLNIPGTSEDNWAFRITRDALSEIDRQKLLYLNTIYSRR